MSEFSKILSKAKEERLALERLLNKSAAVSSSAKSQSAKSSAAAAPFKTQSERFKETGILRFISHTNLRKGR